MSSCIKYELREVTPGMAATWLSHNTGNRKISLLNVTKLKNSILNDNWEITHQGIAIDEYGNLIDGQHRCSAIVEAGKTVKVWVATYSGATTAMKKMIDIGAKRTVSQITGIHVSTCEIMNFFSRILGTSRTFQSTDLNLAFYNTLPQKLKDILEVMTVKKIPAPCKAAFFLYIAFNLEKENQVLNLFDKVSNKGPNRYVGLSVKESSILNLIETSDFSNGREDAFYKCLYLIGTTSKKLYINEKFKSNTIEQVNALFSKALKTLNH